MTGLTKTERIASNINKLRLVPRAMVLAYGYLFFEVAMWFMGIPVPTATQAAFVSVMVGASAGIFGLYTSSGNK